MVVSRTLFLFLSINTAPSMLSSSLIPADSVDWVMKSVSAALWKFNVSDTAIKYFSWRIVGEAEVTVGNQI